MTCLVHNSEQTLSVRLTQQFLHSKRNGYAAINRHYTVTEISSTTGTMTTPPCFCHQNCICKRKIAREGEPGIVAEYAKGAGVIFFRDMLHFTHNFLGLCFSG